MRAGLSGPFHARARPVHAYFSARLTDVPPPAALYSHPLPLPLRRPAQDEGETDLKTHYELSDAVYAKASVPLVAEQPVFLWLGANVMLEYPLDEAIALLTNNLSMAQKTLAQLVSDLGFLKDQMTTSEVNIARVFNWDVRERRKKGEQSASGGEEGNA